MFATLSNLFYKDENDAKQTDFATFPKERVEYLKR